VTAVVLSFEMRRLSMLIRGQKAVGKAEGTAA